MSTPTSNNESESRDSQTGVTDALTPDFARANTAFALELFTRVSQADEAKNVFISPASIAIALAMTANGARGDTLQAMLNALGNEDITPERLNAEYAALQSVLKQADPEVTLHIANSLWAAAGVPFNADFEQRTQRFYDARVSALDFSQPDAADTINAWVRDSTNGKIDGIVGELSPETVLVLVNAIYFNGAWQRPFNEAQTQELPFNLLDGTQKPTPMMFQSGLFDYLRGEGFQAVRLPYDGGSLRMLVFLPDEDRNLSQFRESLTVDAWQAWAAQFAPKQGALFLPRFRVEYGVALNDALAQMGMALAFDAEQADFSGMRPIPPTVFISNVQHKAYVDVNERGTEAAAATSVEMGVTSARPIEDTFTMTVDRPFFIAIEDTRTGSLIFTGAVVEPTQPQ